MILYRIPIYGLKTVAKYIVPEENTKLGPGDWILKFLFQSHNQYVVSEKQPRDTYDTKLSLT